MRLHNEFITHDAGDEHIMVAVGQKSHIFKGLVHNNESAAFIVELLKSEISKAELVEKVFAKYDAPKEIIEQDIECLLEQLRGIDALDEN